VPWSFPFTWFGRAGHVLFADGRMRLAVCCCCLRAELASDALKNRVVEVCLADLQKGDEDQSYRKIRLRIDDIQGKNCLTNFHGMNFTTDKLRSLIRKWQTLIECSGAIPMGASPLLALCDGRVWWSDVVEHW
jgi:hypothetical protein